MTEGDAPIEVKNCNEGFTLFGMLDFHVWRWENYRYSSDPSARVVIEECRTCGARRERRETATWN